MRKLKLPWTLLHVIVMLGLLVGFAGCTEDDDDEPTGPVMGSDEYARDGWTLFEAGDYEKAIENFDKAIDAGTSSSDPYSGAGWARYMSGDNDGAESKWNSGLAQQIGLKNDINTGLGYLSFDKGEYGAAINYLLGVIDVSGNYRFIHMPNFNVNRLNLTLAQAHYLSGSYTESLAKVKILNPIFVLIPANAESWNLEEIAALSAEIERLFDEIGA